MTDLTRKSCQPCAPGTPPLLREQARNLLAQTPGWSLNDEVTELSRTFKFRNYHETMAFVNAQAWVAHREDHHPDLEVGYNRCHVRFSTHSIKGLSENDFICAAKLNALLGE
ncbi:MAG: 4a-hydroxytetrahydrobiopterin dehydratase [Gammaproteobacteria bacterium]|nr:4a-hydroxytetrahydrobiopterin dehydratase [Gammaproteobacteria bacterium]